MSALPAKSRLGRGLGGLIAKAAPPAPPAPPAKPRPTPATAVATKMSAAAKPAASAPKSATEKPAKASASKATSKRQTAAASRNAAVRPLEKKAPRAAAPVVPAVAPKPAASQPGARPATTAPVAAPIVHAASVARTAAPEAASPVASQPAATPNGLPGYLEIPVLQIEPSPYQARRLFAPESLHELADSICSEGLLQPIVVRAKPGTQGQARYQLVAGERRWRAFQLLKLKTIPARVVEAGDASSAALGLIENLQRDGLNPIEEAHGFASLIRDFDLTQETAAARVGRSRASVANTLRLLSLDEELQGYLAKGLLTIGHAKVLLGVEPTAQRALLARRVIEEALSVRATERLVQEAAKPGRSAQTSRRGAAPRNARDAEAVAAIEQRLISKLGARVAIMHTPKKGRIVIEYRGNEDLQRVLEKLGLEL